MAPKKASRPLAPIEVNQKAPVFNDRRTKRQRDKSSQNRKAIERSFRGE